MEGVVRVWGCGLRAESAEVVEMRCSLCEKARKMQRIAVFCLRNRYFTAFRSITADINLSRHAAATDSTPKCEAACVQEV